MLCLVCSTSVMRERILIHLVMQDLISRFKLEWKTFLTISKFVTLSFKSISHLFIKCHLKYQGWCAWLKHSHEWYLKSPIQVKWELINLLQYAKFNSVLQMYFRYYHKTPADTHVFIIPLYFKTNDVSARGCDQSHVDLFFRFVLFCG